jgi:hypothetical protein
MRNPWKLTSFALVAVLATVIGRNVVTSAEAEPQPKMHAALDYLRSARAALEQADHDKGGHRVKAIQLTNSAISEVEQGIKFDNRH